MDWSKTCSILDLLQVDLTSFLAGLWWWGGGGRRQGMGWGFDCLCWPWGRAFDRYCSLGEGDIWIFLFIRRYFNCAFLGSSLGMDSNVQPGVGKFGCNWLEWFSRGQGIWGQIFEKCEIPTPCRAPLPPRRLNIVDTVYYTRRFPKTIFKQTLSRIVLTVFQYCDAVLR